MIPIILLIITILFTSTYAQQPSSQKFYLMIETPNTILTKSSLYISYEDNRLYISNNTNPEPQGFIFSNGSLILDQEKNIGIAIQRNYLLPSTNETKFASPFSIQNGYLKLYSHDFHAVPSGMDGIYVIGSINAAAGRPEVITVKIRARIAERQEGRVLDLSVVGDFDPLGYEGSSKSISARTKPYNMHHGNNHMMHSKQGDVAGGGIFGNMLFTFMNLVF